MALDNAQLSSLIGAIYESASSQNQWQGFLDALRDRFPGIACAIAGFSTDIAVPIFTQSGFAADWVEKYEASATLINDSVKHMVGKPIGEVFGYTIVQPEEYWSMNLVKNWLEPQGFGMSSMAVLASSGDRFLAINIAYKKECSQHFRLEVETALSLLTGHIIRAMDLYRRAAELQVVSYSLKGLCDSIALPMLVTDQNARLVFTNTTGASYLQRSEALKVGTKGELRAHSLQSNHQLVQRISDVAVRGVTSGLLLGGRYPNLGLCIVPLTGDDADVASLDQRLFGQSQLVGLLVCQRHAAVLESGLLREVFGLSDAEAQIGGLLLTGLSPDVIASRLDRSIRTIRNHIQSIYQKIDVTSQGELADALGAFRVFGAMIDQKGNSAQLN